MPTPPPTPPSSTPTSPIYPSSPHLSSTSLLQPLSEMPQMRRQHTTDGYRAGLSAGKEDPTTAQTGFDQGYPLGILLGSRVGFLLAALAELERFGGVVDGTRKAAEGELGVVGLMEGMGGVLGRGVVEELEGMEMGDAGDVDVGVEGKKSEMKSVDESWVDEIEAIEKWSRVVEDAGREIGVELTWKRN